MSDFVVNVDFVHKVIQVDFDKDTAMAATTLMRAAAEAAASAERAETWAEGIDAHVEELGGEHSSKGWATISGSSANAAHDSEVAAKASEDAAAQSAAEAAGINYLVRKNSTYYKAGVVAFYQTIPSPLVLECTAPGTTAATAPDFSGAQEDDTITDGTVVWTYKSLLSGSGGSEEAADINMTNYVKPGSYTPVSASDNVLTAIGKIEAKPTGVVPQIMVTAPTGCTVTATNEGTTLTAIESSGTYEFDVPNFGDWTVTCAKTIDGTTYSTTKVISVLEVRRYEVDMHYGIRFGVRINKNESDPSVRVEYLYDAVGKTPAHMDFANSVFDYGDWGNVWFVTDNKPLMLKSNGTVDYYLDTNDYDKKVDGTSSDVANTSYDGNAMAQFPLVWVKRYEDSQYEYEIISNMQIDADYKAYAHTRADGSIADYFYWSLFGGSGNSSKIRSLAGQTLSHSLTTQQEINGCTANGSLWYTHTWSQRELIRTLLILMGKSTNTQSVFGYGNCRSASDASGMLATGTLNAMGQFYGYSDSTHQVKVFHVEKFWGDQLDRTAGLINSGGKVYAKMTPEGQGYRVTDVTGYTNTGYTITGTNNGYISAGAMTEFGFIPHTVSGSSSTYYCDIGGMNNGQLDYLVSGASAYYASAAGGAFAANLGGAPSLYSWHHGCGISCEQPVQS